MWTVHPANTLDGTYHNLGSVLFQSLTATVVQKLPVKKCTAESTCAGLTCVTLTKKIKCEV